MSGLRKRPGIIVMSVLFVGTVVSALVAVQASARTGGSGRTQGLTRPTAPTRPVAPAGVRPATVRPFVAATNAHCGQTITASLTLNGDLNCSASPVATALTIAGTSAVTLNLNGHYIFGDGSQTLVLVTGTSDIVENGYLEQGGTGIYVTGSKANITKNVVATNTTGVFDAGTTTKVTNNTASNNFSVGIYGVGTGGSYTGNRVASNVFGIVSQGDKQTISTNAADSNVSYGIYLSGTSVTVTGNSANYNGLYGIDNVAQFLLNDGGGNTAHGNGDATHPQQCIGVACS